MAKLAIVLAGADHDGDSYAHAMAGRRLLLDPADISIHWVWLPLLHALYAAATAVGGGLSTLRFVNVLASSASPLLLAWFLRDHLRRAFPGDAAASQDAAASPIPWLAGALLAIDPLCVSLGVTGQTEPLFQLLVLGACVACERRAFAIAGILFGMAALTRYEAWGLVPVLLWIALKEPRLRPRAMLVGALPALLISLWCLAHFALTREPLQFLRVNREFAQAYLASVGYFWGRAPNLALMAVFYVAIVPVSQMLGPAHALAFAGVPRGFRVLPRTLLLVGAALLAIVTWLLLRGTHLGLPRHAVAIAPLFCALTAVGTIALADRAARRLPTISAERSRQVGAFAVLALVLFTRTVPRTLELFGATQHAFSEQARAAAALRDIAAPGEPIFCDDDKIEVLSELGPARFTRSHIAEVAPLHVRDLAQRHGSALVVSPLARAAHLPGGRPLWSHGELLILRFEAPR